jgi:hypothetical protein
MMMTGPGTTPSVMVKGAAAACFCMKANNEAREHCEGQPFWALVLDQMDDLATVAPNLTVIVAQQHTPFPFPQRRV